MAGAVESRDFWKSRVKRVVQSQTLPMVVLLAQATHRYEGLVSSTDAEVLHRASFRAVILQLRDIVDHTLARA